MAIHLNTASFGVCQEVAYDQVQLWQVPLIQPDAVVESLARTLSCDELQRAERFCRPDLRRRFIVCRGALRDLLARRCELAPAELEFVYSDRGWPTLRSTPGAPAVSFNLSHSHELALIAISEGAAVGVDLERMRAVPQMARIVDHHFSPAEQHDWKQLPPAIQLQAFFLAWTAKEALLKACGLGIARGLAEVEVEVRPDQPARILNWHNRPRSESWELLRLFPADGYVGALAYAGPLAASSR